jgi:hypothetical protein
MSNTGHNIFANFKYSLSEDQIFDLQFFLRFHVPETEHQNPAWQLPHSLTYSDSWSMEPEFPPVGSESEDTGEKKLHILRNSKGGAA